MPRGQFVQRRPQKIGVRERGGIVSTRGHGDRHRVARAGRGDVVNGVADHHHGARLTTRVLATAFDRTGNQARSQMRIATVTTERETAVQSRASQLRLGAGIDVASGDADDDVVARREVIERFERAGQDAKSLAVLQFVVEVWQIARDESFAFVIACNLAAAGEKDLIEDRVVGLAAEANATTGVDQRKYVD